jgi:hypothetical protein
MQGTKRKKYLDGLVAEIFIRRKESCVQGLHMVHEGYQQEP